MLNTHIHIPYTHFTVKKKKKKKKAHLGCSVFWPLVHRDVSLWRTMEWVLGWTGGCGGRTAQGLGWAMWPGGVDVTRAWVGPQEGRLLLHAAFRQPRGHELSERLFGRWCQRSLIFGHPDTLVFLKGRHDQILNIKSVNASFERVGFQNTGQGWS